MVDGGPIFPGRSRPFSVDRVGLICARPGGYSYADDLQRVGARASELEVCARRKRDGNAGREIDNVFLIGSMFSPQLTAAAHDVPEFFNTVVSDRARGMPGRKLELRHTGFFSPNQQSHFGSRDSAGKTNNLDMANTRSGRADVNIGKRIDRDPGVFRRVAQAPVAASASTPRFSQRRASTSPIGVVSAITP